MELLKATFGCALSIMRMNINVFGFEISLFALYLFSMVGVIIMYIFYRTMK